MNSSRTPDDLSSDDPGSVVRKAVDLNADLAEEVTDDLGLLAVVTSANVACGYHAGTPTVIRAACDEAVARGVVIGAQVSYLDREHFGRRDLDVPFTDLRDQVADQVATLAEIAEEAGTRVRYVKPHGALYNRVVHDEEQARAVLAGSLLDGVALPVLGLPGGALLRLAEGEGRSIWREGFPDRGYTPEGRLVPRDQPGALLGSAEEIVGQARRLAPQVDSLCLHGDSPGAVAHARAVRRALEEGGYRLAPFLGGGTRHD